MKKLLRTSLALVILLAGACAACSSAQLQSVQPTQSFAINRALNSTVTIYNKSDNMICAGEFVGDKVIVTAYHCAVAATLSNMEIIGLHLLGVDMTTIMPEEILNAPVTVSTYAAVADSIDSHVTMVEKGTLKRLDQKHDLAVIVLNNSAHAGPTKVPVSWHYPAVGQDVFAIGHPDGLEYTFSRGYVSTVCRKFTPGTIPAGFDPRACWLQVDLRIYGGSSGGGLYDKNGELIGVCSMGGDSGFGFFVPIKYAEPLLSGLI